MKNSLIFISVILLIGCGQAQLSNDFRLDDKLYDKWQSVTQDSIYSLIKNNTELKNDYRYRNLLFYTKSNSRVKFRSWVKKQMPLYVLSEIESKNLKKLIVVEFHHESLSMFRDDVYFMIVTKDRFTGYHFRSSIAGDSAFKKILFKKIELNLFLGQIQSPFKIIQDNDPITGDNLCVNGEFIVTIFEKGEIYEYLYLTDNFRQDQLEAFLKLIN